MTQWTVPVLIALCGATLLCPCLGCEDKPKESKPASDAGAPRVNAVDPNLAEAVEAAGAKSKSDGGAARDSADGPPPTGVFAAGKADEQLARGEPPKIALGDTGHDPKVSLVSSIVPGYKQNGIVELKLRVSRAALPGIQFDLTLEAPKAKPAAAAAPGAVANPEPAADGTPMSAKINGVKLTDDVGPQGQQLLAQLNKMRGSRIDYRIGQGGIGTDFRYRLAPGAAQDLDLVLRALAEALETTTIGVPNEPVGQGAFWMVTTRGSVSGAEVISYRLVKLVKVEGDRYALNVNTKRYAVSSKMELPGLPPGADLDQFQSTADGDVTLIKGSPIASDGNVKQTFVATFLPAAGSDQRLAVQSSAEVGISFGNR